MAVPLSADAARNAMKTEGVKLQTVGSWKTHNRNSKGSWGPVHGVMLHHTVTTGTQNSLSIVKSGYRGLPGPLCHGMIDKDGTVYLVGWGRTNHAGLGDGSVLRAVIAEKELPKAHFQSVDGNARFYGFECVNLGNGSDPWPDAQVDAMVRASAALCRKHGWRGRSVIGHKEWQTGKVDPRGINMDDIRRRVDKLLDQ